MNLMTMTLLLALMVFALSMRESLRVTWLKRTVAQQGDAQRLAVATFKELTAALAAQADTLEAQGVVNDRQLTAVKALQARLATQGEAILQLHAQDRQFMDILVAVNLVQTQTPPLTVN